MNAKELIEKWINGKCSFYFFLPDGPYGRPFDNQYSIEEINIENDGLEIIFSDEIILQFKGQLSVINEGDNLLIHNFTECLFQVKNICVKKYDSGDVTLNGF
ncbi:hypothetical protein LPW36_03970 [Jinshanibacter sp. LJY008]|uniref:Uncharacterized protein n=1 Tax=Limnobaculum eriocheiris TaxID=2897391 RepID=A0A9X1MVY9_9GAMM|nr:hypothetical protein [Limnobaculum eriocheiris]MCD1125190.1 hypothetical protein [Limnobaculum eriocheiris]